MSKDATYTRRINLYINGKQVENNISSVKKEMTKLVAAQTKMTIGSKEYVAQGQKIQTLNGILKQHRVGLNQSEAGWRGMSSAANGFNKYFGMITAGLASITGMILSFRQAADAFNKFEERLSNLSALTGLEGSALEWLGKTAKETSVITTEAGIRIKQSATDILDAYTKVGSQRPELLKNKEALHAVTLDAIILSEAAKMELSPAVEALATTLNQFNLSSSESARVINVLAAGSKEGAGDIPYLATAMEKVGTTANLMGMSIEQTTGVIEAVAPKYKRAEMAGNSFDKVLLKMREGQIGYKKGYFDLNDAIDELQVRFGNGETAAQIFGVEHAKMAEILVMNRKEINHFTNAVTGTEIALEQARKNTNNAAAELAQAKNRVQLLAIELGEKLSPALTKSIFGFGKFLALMINIPKWIKENQTLLIALAGAYAAYNGQLITATALMIKDKAVRLASIALDKVQIMWRTAQVIGMQAWIAVTGKATIAQLRWIASMRAMGAAMLSNPVGVILAGLTALYLAIKLYSKYNGEALRKEQERKKAVDDLTRANKQLSEVYDSLKDQISNINRVGRERQEMIRQETVALLNLAKSELEAAQAKQKKLAEDHKELSFWQARKAELFNNGKADLEKARRDKMMSENAKEAADVMNESIADLENQIKSLESEVSGLDELFNAEAIGDSIVGDTLAGLEEKLYKYQTALKYAALGGEDYLRIQNKIANTQNLMDSFTTPDSPEATQAAAQDDTKELERLNAEKLKLEEKLAAEIKGIRHALRLSEFSDEDQDLLNLKAKHADLLAEFEKHGLDTLELKQLQERELMLLVSDQENKRLKLKAEAQQKIDAITASDRDRAVTETTAKYQELIELANKYGLDTSELYRLMNEDLKAIEEETFAGDVDIFGMSEEDWESLFEKFQIATSLINQIGEIWGNINQIMANKEQKEIIAFEKRQKSEKDLLADRLDKGVITQEQYNARIAKLDSELDSKKEEIQKRQAEREKKLKIFQATTSMAAGIIEAISMAKMFPFNFILAGLIAAAGITQIAAIASAPAAYAEGGFTNGDRIYRAGEEGKEWIGNNKMVNDPYTGPVIAGLEAVQRGQAPASMFAPAMPNFDEMVALPAFAAGGYAGQGSTPTPVTISPQAAPNNETIGQLLNEFVMLRTYLSDPLNRQAYISNNTLKRQATEDAMRNSLGRID